MDLVIRADYVVTLAKDRPILKQGAVGIEGDRIAYVGRADELRERGEIEIDARGMSVFPGLVNAHTHMFQVLMRGLGVDLPLLDWLKSVIWPLSLALTEEDVYWAALLGAIENLKSGATTVIDNHYIHTSPRNTDRVLEALRQSGVRGCVVRGYYDRVVPEPFREDIDTVVRESERLIREWHGREEGRLMVGVAPMTPWFCSAESMARAKELSDRYGVPLHIHTAETKAEVEALVKEVGMRHVEYLDHIRLLGPRTHVVHGVWVTKREIQMLAESGTHVVHNPVSNMYLGSGVAPIPQMLRSGVNVALGTDGPASNNNQDTIASLKFAACLHKVSNVDPTAITAWQVLEMATVSGARLLGLERDLGTIEVGKKADLIVVDMRKPHIAPVHDPVSALVYNANGNDVSTVVVDGRVVVQDRRVTTVDERLIVEKATESAMSLVERAKEIEF